jgi:hypothetical protein
VCRYTISRPVRRTPPHVAQHVVVDTSVSHHFDDADPFALADRCAAAMAARLRLFLSRCLKPIVDPSNGSPAARQDAPPPEL